MSFFCALEILRTATNRIAAIPAWHAVVSAPGSQCLACRNKTTNERCSNLNTHSTLETSSETTPRNLSSREPYQWLGPMDSVSNIRPVRFATAFGRSGLEYRYRKLCEDTWKWMNDHWTVHNIKYMQVSHYVPYSINGFILTMKINLELFRTPLVTLSSAVIVGCSDKLNEIKPTNTLSDIAIYAAINDTCMSWLTPSR